MAGLVAVMAAACVEEESFIQVDTDSFLAPVLNDFTPAITELTEAQAAETYATVQFTAADYGVASSINYTLYASVAGTDFAKEKQVGMPVTSPKAEIKVTVLDVNKVLTSLNCVPGTEVELDFRVKAEWMGEKVPVDGSALYSNAVQASAVPYNMEKTYDPVWVIGDYCGWSHDNTLFLWNYKEDGKIYTGLIDFGKADADGNIVSAAKNGWKITGKAAWDDTCNWGEETKAKEADEPSSIQLISSGGSQDIVRYAKRFYGFSFDKTTLELKKLVSFDQMAVIGLNKDWENDIVMEYSKYKQRFYVDVEVPAETEFKFRADGKWDYNLGGDLEGLASGGGNITIGKGNYRIYLDMNNADVYTATISADAYGTQEGAAAPEPAPEPEPEPEPVVGWSLIGAFNGWGADLMLASDGKYQVVKGVELEGELKFRENGQWDYTDDAGNKVVTNLGLAADVTFSANTELTLAPDGGNINVTKGTYDVYLDPENAKAWFITDGSYPGGEEAPEMSEWGLIGSLAACNNWGANIPLYVEGDYSVAKGVVFADGDSFKFRKGDTWGVELTYEGAISIDAKLALIDGTGGKQNSSITKGGTYDVYLANDLSAFYVMTPGKTPADAGEAEKVYVDPSADTFVVGFSGSALGWDDPSFDAKDRASFVSKNVTDEETYAGTYEFKLEGLVIAENDELKVRINGQWIGVGGATIEGLTVTGEDNFIAGEAGTFTAVITFVWDGNTHSDVKVVFSK